MPMHAVKGAQCTTDCPCLSRTRLRKFFLIPACLFNLQEFGQLGSTYRLQLPSDQPSPSSPLQPSMDQSQSPSGQQPSLSSSAQPTDEPSNGTSAMPSPSTSSQLSRKPNSVLSMRLSEKEFPSHSESSSSPPPSNPPLRVHHLRQME